MKNMKVMKEKINPFILFMVINNLLLSLYFLVSRLKLVAKYEYDGIIIKVKQGRRVGYVPLCDVEVKFKEN